MSIVYRQELGRELTWSEADNNFAELKAGVDSKKSNFDVLPVTQGGTGQTSVDAVKVAFDIATKTELASSAAGKGAEMVEYHGSTVEAALDERLPEIGNYAALDAYTGDSTAVLVYGVQNVFDGGAGVFRRTADTPSAANGIYRQDALGRWWKRDFDGRVNVKWFGAKGGSVVTDDTLAIKAAIAYVKAQAVKPVVWLPAGWYGISDSLIISSSVRLEGEHNNSVTSALVWIGAGTGPVISIEPSGAGLTYRNAVEKITIHGLLLSDVVRPKPVGIRIRNTSETFISGVSIFDCTDAFEIDCSAILWVEKTSVSNCAKAFKFNQTSTAVISSMIALTELNIWNTSDAIFSFDSGAVNNIFVSDSWFEYHQNVIKNGNTGSYTTGWNNFVFARCKMSDVAASGYANSKLINVTAVASNVSQTFINTSFRECNITVNSSDYICKFDLNGNTGATTDIGGWLTIDNSLLFGAPTAVVNSNTNKTTLRIKGSSYAQAAYYSGSVIPFSSGSVRQLDSNGLIQYTPAWTSSGTAPSLGNGSLIGRYMVRNGICRVQLELTVGSTTTIGTGTYSFSLPIAHASGWGQEVGACSILVSGTGYFVGAALVASGASVVQVATHGASVLMSQTAPAALTSGSKVSICIEYVVG